MTNASAASGQYPEQIEEARKRRDLKHELRSYGIHEISGHPLRDIGDELELRVVAKYYRNQHMVV